VTPRGVRFYLVTADTSWVIAAERNPTAARQHLAALSRVGQLLVVSPVVIVEARQRCANVGAVDVVLARLRKEPLLPEDGIRASELLRIAGQQAGGGRAASSRIHEIGTIDALVAAMAERLGRIVYSADSRHLSWLRQAGTGIVVRPIPF
jgi:predicted nucleic acid-binding protein